MKIIGIDLSASATNTAVCVIDTDTRIIEPPKMNCDDDALRKVIEVAEVIGIDAPFGWPETFRHAVANNSMTDAEWSESDRSKLRLRCTDKALVARLEGVKKENVPNPLSASADKLAVAAWRAMFLLGHFKADSDRSGTKKFEGRSFVEVYPAASLCWWDVARKAGTVSYKNKAAKELRKTMLNAIRRQTNLDTPDSYADTDHNLDALVAALTALAAFKGQTHPPDHSEMDCAKSEGWIHLPSRSLTELKLS